MSKKKKKDDEEEIIIGYNSKPKPKSKKDNPPKKKKLKKAKNKKDNPEIIEEKPKKKIKKKKKKKHRINFKKILLILLKLIIAIGLIAGVVLFLFVSPVFNIQEIIVNGAFEISENVYIATSGIEIGENIFNIDKTAIRVEIKKEPYVESIEVKCIYPKTVELNITERTVSYVIEQNGKYFYLDKNGYLLESSLSPLAFQVIKGIKTNLEELESGARIKEEDLEKFDDLIKIVDAVKNNDITAKLSSIDITDDNNYILEFAEEKKNVMLGNTLDLSAKMAWIKLFIKEKQNESGNIYLNTKDIYFSPK